MIEKNLELFKSSLVNQTRNYEGFTIK